MYRWTLKSGPMHTKHVFLHGTLRSRLSQKRQDQDHATGSFASLCPTSFIILFVVFGFLMFLLSQIIERCCNVAAQDLTFLFLYLLHRSLNHHEYVKRCKERRTENNVHYMKTYRDNANQDALNDQEYRILNTVGSQRSINAQTKTNGSQGQRISAVCRDCAWYRFWSESG